MFSRLFFMAVLAVLIIASSLRAEENKTIINDDLELIKISDNCYIHTSYFDIAGFPHYPSNGLVYVTEGKAALVDTPWDTTLTQQLLNYLTDSLSLSIESIIVTHWHSDRMGGLEVVHNKDAKSFAAQKTIEICKEKERPLPQVGFTDSLTVKLNGKTIQAVYLGAGHSLDNIFVFLPEEKILIGGCAVKSAAAMGLGYTADGDLQQWPVTLKAVLARFPQSKIVVPGHGALGDFGLIHHTLDLLEAKGK